MDCIDVDIPRNPDLFSPAWVVTLERDDRKANRQQFLERPAMLGQPQCHGRRAVVIATQALRSRQPQGRMSPPEIMIKELQAEQGIEGGIAFGKGMRLTCEGT